MKKMFISVVCILSLLLLTGCGKSSIKGTWYYYNGINISSDVYYKFNDDKTGEYVYSNGKNSFIYEVRKDKLILSYFNSTNSNEYEYKIENDTLTIKDLLGSDVVYIKSKN